METFGIMFVYVSKKYGMFLMQFFFNSKKIADMRGKAKYDRFILHLCWMLKIKNISIFLIFLLGKILLKLTVFDNQSSLHAISM